MTTPDRYDRMDTEELHRICRIWGHPSWCEFPPGTIRELLRDDDLDREDIARWDPA